MGRLSRIQNTTTTTTSDIPQSQTFCAVRARSATYSDLGSSQTSFYIGLKWLTLNTFRYFNFYSVVAQQGRGPPCPLLLVRNLGLKERKSYPAENRVLAPLENFQTDARNAPKLIFCERLDRPTCNLPKNWDFLPESILLRQTCTCRTFGCRFCWCEGVKEIRQLRTEQFRATQEVIVNYKWKKVV